MATIKQKKTAAILLENNGKISVSKAMKQAGYSSATSKNPQQLTSSKSWEILLDEYLPEEELARIHRQQLKAKMVEFGRWT